MSDYRGDVVVQLSPDDGNNRLLSEWNVCAYNRIGMSPTSRRQFTESTVATKQQKGKPPKVIRPIPDTFENVIKALVKPVKPAKDEGIA